MRLFLSTGSPFVRKCRIVLREKALLGHCEEQAVEFCGLLRQAFERALEDKLLGGVVTRGDGGVHPQRMRLVALTQEICQLVDRGMDENSAWVHDRSREANPAPRMAYDLA